MDVHCLVLPEAALFSAWSQWWAAKDLRDEINRLGQQISRPTRFSTFAKWERSECVACNPCNKLDELVNKVEDPTIRRQKHENCECLDDSRTEDNVPNDTNVESSQHRDVHANLLDKSKAFVPWTMDQAFFAVSGGVAIDTSPFWHRPYMSLTPSGIVLLAEMGLLPRFSQQDAQDRSRADAIAKSITCLQASWFFIQGVARVCAGLPFTLLELHTMIHIICALAIYAIWFSKPYGATSPMICSEPAMVNLGALLTLRCHAGRAYNEWSCPIKDEVLVRSVLHFHPDAEDEEIFAHWDAANKAIGFLRKRNIHLPFSQISTESDEGLEFEDKFFVNTVSNLSVRGRFSNGVNKMETLISRILFLVFPLLYCGSHLSAWNFQFPTVVEMWMWRCACFIMLCAPPSFLHFQVVLSAYYNQDAEIIDETDEEIWVYRSAVVVTRIVLKWAFFIFHASIATIVKHTFMLSRLYLVVESLASLRSPANGTYTTVNWTEYMPHFS